MTKARLSGKVVHFIGTNGPGLSLAMGLALATLVLVSIVPHRHFVLPDVLVAMVLGTVVVNTRLGRLLKLKKAAICTGRFGAGLTFVGKPVLRMSVVLMGLRVQSQFFGAHKLAAIAIVIASVLPTTFLLTHALAIPLRVPRALADLVAAGTMICGASAVNAVAPVIGARRQDTGIALATVFLFSAVALVAFRPVAAMTGLSSHDCGLWSGLAVNDLASAVAVGAQMGPGGAEMAAASKSARILMLAPILVLFALGRRKDVGRGSLGRTAARHLPLFVAGFVVLAGVRALGDFLFGGASAWTLVIVANRHLVDFAMLMVSAGIGLNMELRGLASAGLRAVILGAIAASSTAGLSLTLLTLAAREAYRPLLMVSTGSLVTAFLIYGLTRTIALTWDRTRHTSITASDPLLASSATRLMSRTGEVPVL